MLNGAAAPAGRAAGPARSGSARSGSARRARGMEPFLGCTGAALLLCFSYAGLRPVEAGRGPPGPGGAEGESSGRNGEDGPGELRGAPGAGRGLGSTGEPREGVGGHRWRGRGGQGAPVPRLPPVSRLSGGRLGGTGCENGSAGGAAGAPSPCPCSYPCGSHQGAELEQRRRRQPCAAHAWVGGPSNPSWAAPWDPSPWDMAHPGDTKPGPCQLAGSSKGHLLGRRMSPGARPNPDTTRRCSAPCSGQTEPLPKCPVWVPHLGSAVGAPLEPSLASQPQPQPQPLPGTLPALCAQTGPSPSRAQAVWLQDAGGTAASICKTLIARISRMPGGCG